MAGTVLGGVPVLRAWHEPLAWLFSDCRRDWPNLKLLGAWPVLAVGCRGFAGAGELGEPGGAEWWERLFVALLMSHVNSRVFSATQYALLSRGLCPERDQSWPPRPGCVAAARWAGPAFFLFTAWAALPLFC